MCIYTLLQQSTLPSQNLLKMIVGSAMAQSLSTFQASFYCSWWAMHKNEQSQQQKDVLDFEMSHNRDLTP